MLRRMRGWFAEQRLRAYCRRYLIKAPKVETFVVVYFDDFDVHSSLVLKEEWRHSKFFAEGMAILWINKEDDLYRVVSDAKEMLYK
ncbi:hypothetical protein D3C74_49870 [compost metagenome]